MMRILLLCTLLTTTANALGAQSVPDIVGREARVWSDGSSSSIGGRVDLATELFLRLETDATFCGAEGCQQSYSTPWSRVDRLQVAGTSNRQRLFRAAVVGTAMGLLVGPGLSSCGDGGTQQKIRSCTERILAVTVAVGVTGFVITRRSWKDVPIPQ